MNRLVKTMKKSRSTPPRCTPPLPITPSIPTTIEFTTSCEGDESSAVAFSQFRRPSSSLPIRVAASLEPTLPIPIRSAPDDLWDRREDEATSAAQFDFMTWQMYQRISTARRLRAFARGGDHSAYDPSHPARHRKQAQEDLTIATADISEVLFDGESGVEPDEGIFVLDLGV